MRHRSYPYLIALLGLSIACAGSAAIAKKRSRPATEPVVTRPARPALPDPMQLKPGQYLWFADRVTPGPVEVVMSLSQQRAYAFQSGKLIGLATISSGTKGRESPFGRFQILEKKKLHRSIRYDNAPMPNMMRLNWYGVAMHGGHVPGYPASHGCYRLPPAFAEKLYAIAEVGSFVFVTHDAPPTPYEALDLARANYETPMVSDRLPRNAQAAVAYAEAMPDYNAAYAQQAAANPAPPPVRKADRPAKSRRSLWDRLGSIF